MDTLYFTEQKENEKAERLFTDCKEICRVVCTAVARSRKIDDHTANSLSKNGFGIITFTAVSLQDAITLKWFYGQNKYHPEQINMAMTFALVNFADSLSHLGLVPIGIESVSATCVNLKVAFAGTLATPRAFLQKLCSDL